MAQAPTCQFERLAALAISHNGGTRNASVVGTPGPCSIRWRRAGKGAKREGGRGCTTEELDLIIRLVFSLRRIVVACGRSPLLKLEHIVVGIEPGLVGGSPNHAPGVIEAIVRLRETIQMIVGEVIAIVGRWIIPAFWLIGKAGTGDIPIVVFVARTLIVIQRFREIGVIYL